MPSLPPSSDYTSQNITQGQKKAFMASVRTYLATLLGTDGTVAQALYSLCAPFSSTIPKSANCTAVAADWGKKFKCTNTWTLSFDDVANLPDGWNLTVINAGSGTITLDPYLTQTIDGGATLTIAAGLTATVTSDGTELRTIGRGGVSSFNTRTGAVTLSSGDVTTALGYSPATLDVGSLAVGCFALMRVVNTTVSAGATVSASYLASYGFDNVGAITFVGPPTGTWRNVSGGTLGLSAFVGLFQRIA